MILKGAMNASIHDLSQDIDKHSEQVLILFSFLLALVLVVSIRRSSAS